MQSSSGSSRPSGEPSSKSDISGNDISMGTHTGSITDTAGLEDDHGLSSSSETASIASSGDTALTEPLAPYTTSKASVDSALQAGGAAAPCATDDTQYTTFDQLKRELHWSLKSRAIANTGPEPFKWFNPSAIPSPAAFHFWRRDQCQRYKLKLGSTDEIAFYEFFIDTNYHPKIRQRIKDDQTLFQQHLVRCQRRVKHNDAMLANGNCHTGLSAAEHELYERVDWIFNGVAEAACRHSLPAPTAQEQAALARPNEPPPAAEQTPRNKKGFPIVYFTERDNFHEQWNDYCRTQGLNAQNVLYDYAPFASHNPYSLYHKVKYGDFGSPHPYVPFAITNAKEWRKSCEDQARQEEEALAWLALRRKYVGTTQQELDLTGRRIRGDQEEPTFPQLPTLEGGVSSQEASAIPLVPLSISDEAVVDQEIEQPQAMGVEDDARPLVSTETANGMQGSNANGNDTSELQQAASASTADTLNNTTVAAATSISHPITVSVMVPEETMPWLRSRVYSQLQRDHPEKLEYLCDVNRRQLLWPKVKTTGGGLKPAPEHANDFSSTGNAIDKGHVREEAGPIIRLRPAMNLAAIVTDDEVPWRSGGKLLLQKRSPNDSDAMPFHHTLAGAVAGPRWSHAVDKSEEPPSSFRLGNLFLSSCPGKKVRLTGAVRGRGAVCRDLAIDLQRFKSLGVGALVCCLSDAELGVIGVQWEEYMKEAAKLGLDLVRVPMVEGNCPTSQEYLDAWLEEIVYHCTLKGVNVLVHCRGGVGRAGTIAACWLAKMGLVDEFRPPNEVARRGKVLPAQELLWQCLQVVRMRRSSKAIETAEQAAYIAKYGEYLIAQWEKQHPGQEYLGAEYRDMVSSYWDRIRWETDEWVQQEIREAEERRKNDQSSANGSECMQTPSNGLKDSHNHHSNIRSKSAAASPTKCAKGIARPTPTTPKSRVEGGSPLIKLGTYPSPQGPLPQRKASLTNLSVPLAAEGPASTGTDSLPANDQGRSDEGEPSRKRRNTASLSVDDMKLSDAEEPVAVSNLLAKAGADPNAMDDGCACDEDDIETELDAFPVNGRSGEAGWSAALANGAGGTGTDTGTGTGTGTGTSNGTSADRPMPESSLFSGSEAVGPSR